ncbi:hypothetical protein RHMOL_Rhmol09G0115900 [Rhododendron molle]|uniref:Uncharacterized protein n=1 Tax=Rhododendron molle TaxID=49168 RepID=A0ACC0MCF8_RHOML|nr:hypothetical protein RHMOL_Rhmol09G0115900 [Rhododendron molle]
MLCRCSSPKVDSVTTQPPEHRRRLPVEPTCVCTLSLGKNNCIAKEIVEMLWIVFGVLKPKVEVPLYN